jgi:hypothetical protein
MGRAVARFEAERDDPGSVAGRTRYIPADECDVT